MSEERVIQQLRRKLSLLVENGYFSNLEEIANKIGTTQKTLESWADYGSNKITKGLISQKHYPQIIEVFANVIQKQHGNIDIEAVVKGDVSELARYLSSMPRFTFHELVERYAITQSAKVFIDKRTGLTAVTRRSKQNPITQYSVNTNQWFWIEFHTMLSATNTIALQQRDNNWAFTDIEYVREDNRLIMPGLAADGFPDSIREAQWEGINIFYAFQTTKLWPKSIMDMIQSNIPVDSSSLQAIADHFASCPSTNRCIFKVKIDVRGI
jgi:hypothetical protein